jgi:hypothetical protein
MMMQQQAEPGSMTALNGKLVWWGRDTWAWNDGTPAPRVKDITPSWYYNFRIRNYASTSYVEVPMRLAHNDPALAWVRGYCTGQSGDDLGDRLLTAAGRMVHLSARPGGKAIRGVYLVPAADWDAWDADTCLGPKWDRTDEAEILARAAMS